MKLAKMAVGYYTEVTGNTWSKFYDDLDKAMSDSLENQTGDLWLIHSLMNVLIKSGVSVDSFKTNKDAVKAVFDESARKQNGEFFTPVIWAEELHRYMDKEIPGWRENYNVWENSCYTMDTEVLTKRGWLTYDDLQHTDEVYTLNPDTLKGEWSGFYNAFKRQHTGKLVRFKGVGVDLSVTPEHMMFARVDDTYKSMSAQSLLDTAKTSDIQLVLSACLDGNYLYKEDDFNASGIERYNLSLFWQVIGVFLRTGSFYKYDETLATNLSCMDSNILSSLSVLGCIRPGSLHKYSETLVAKFNCADSSLLRSLSALGLLFMHDNTSVVVLDTHFNNFVARYIGTDNRRIPFNLLETQYFSDLMAGLTGGSSFIYTFYKDLAHDIEQLCMQLGYRYKATEVHTRNIDNYIVNVLTDTETTKVAVTEEDYDDYVWDLTTENDNHIFYVRQNGYPVFSRNCGSGNLIRTAKINPDHLFASSLQQDDITLIKNTPELAGCHAFQFDFLSSFDDMFNKPFSAGLPDELRKVFENDEPIIFLNNPPYRTGQANNTEVGRYMSNNIPYLGHINFAKPAYDLYYQFCFQIMNLAALYKLTNCYVCIFGPLTWFTGASANILLSEFERVFEFKDGICISAQEFSDTSESIQWGISATIWKSRGGYQSDPSINYHKDIILDKKFLTPDGAVSSAGKVLYEPPRKKLSAWVHSDSDANAPKKEFPLMSSHLTFKGGDVYEKVAHKLVKMRSDAWGIVMTQNTLTRSAEQSAVMSMPSTIQYEPIVEDNFWRAVASFSFRRVYEADWSVAKKDISAPNTGIEGYDVWLKNSIPLFLFEYKSMMSSLRGVVLKSELNLPEDLRTGITIRNNFFFLTPDEVRENCTDPVILKDLEDNPPTDGQKFMYNVIKESEPYWVPEVRDLYNWCKSYTLRTYNTRKTVSYKGSLECWDAGFQQLRSGLWDSSLDDEFQMMLLKVRKYLVKDVLRFGFVSEVEDATEDM